MATAVSRGAWRPGRVRLAMDIQRSAAGVQCPWPWQRWRDRSQGKNAKAGKRIEGRQSWRIRQGRCGEEAGGKAEGTQAREAIAPVRRQTDACRLSYHRAGDRGAHARISARTAVGAMLR